MKKVRFGIIGLGNQGSGYAKRMFKEGKVDNGVITALCDINTDKIDAVKEAVGEDAEISYFTNYIEMLDSALCDAVIIAVPHYLHPEMVIESLNRGINALCEKPAGVYTKQVRLMNEVASQNKALFGLMFNQRTNCLYRKMREIIAEGGIGELQRVNWIITDWYRTQYYYDSGSWRATWAGEGGGVLINQSPHQLDLVQWVVGKMPSKVRGFCKFGQWHDIEVEDEVTAYFEYDNGATGVFITTTGEYPGTNRFEVSGTKGKLLCENGKLIWTKNDSDSRDIAKTEPHSFVRIPKEIIEVETDGINRQHEGIVNNFANAILGIEPLFVDGKDGIRGVELMNAIELSGWNGGAEVTLPVDEEKYLELLNEHRAISRWKASDDGIVSDTTGTY